MPLTLIEGVRASATTSGTDGVTTQDFAVSGIPWNPVAAMITVSRATAANTDTNQALLSVGFTDGTNEMGVTVQDQNGVGTSFTKTAGFDDAVIRLQTAGSTTNWNARGSFDSWIAGGIRILWDEIPNAAYLVHCTFWFGDGTSAKVGFVTPPSEDSGAAQEAVGFEPNHIITLCPRSATLDESPLHPADLQIAHTIRTTGTTSDTRFISAQQQHSKTTTESTIVLRDNGIVALNYTSGSAIPVTAIETLIPSFHASDGFNISSNGSTGTETGLAIIYLALEYEGKSLSLHAERGETSTGTVNYASGFRTGAAFAINTSLSADSWTSQQNFTGNAASQSLGFFGFSGAQWAVAQHHQDAIASTSNAESRSENNFVFSKGNTGANVIQEATASFHATDGLDLDWIDVIAAGRQFLIIQVEIDRVDGDAAGAIGAPDGSATGSLRMEGTAAGAIGAVDGSATGAQTLRGSAAGAIGQPVGAAVGSQTQRGTAAGAIAAVDGSAAGRLILRGPAAGVLAPIDGTAIGTARMSGTAAGAVLPSDGIATGRLILRGTAAGAIALIDGSAIGAGRITGTAGGAVLPLDGAAVGRLILQGLSAGAIGLIDGAAIGSTSGAGIAAGAIAPIDGLASGNFRYVGVASGAIFLIDGLAVGNLRYVGVAAGALAPIDGLAIGSAVGIALGCEEPMLGSYLSETSLAGRANTESRLLGRFDSETGLEGSHLSESGLLGRLDSETALNGGIC